MSGLYVHIPFCVRKCLYCDFYSVETSNCAVSRRHEALELGQERFLRALEEELGSLPDAFSPDTVFIGGGTPTELSDQDFRSLLALIRQTIDAEHVIEWSCEANPGTLTEAKAAMFKPAGIHRVSLGVQSFQPANLEFLGRIHSGEEAEEAVALLREHGIANINLDLMFGVPGATMEMLQDDLRRLLALRPAHIACYCLTYEEGTPLTDLKERGFVRPLNPEQELEQYQEVIRTLKEAGYRHYEISNFALPGFECRHNLLYWSAGEYLGVGPAAHSHWAGARFGNVRSIDAWCSGLLSGSPAREFEERLEPAAKARETLVMSLRRLDGIDTDEFEKATGFAVESLYDGELSGLLGEGLLETHAGRLRLTEEGLYLSNRVFAELV